MKEAAPDSSGRKVEILALLLNGRPRCVVVGVDVAARSALVDCGWADLHELDAEALDGVICEVDKLCRNGV